MGLIYGKAQWWEHALEEMLDALAYMEGLEKMQAGTVDSEQHACVVHNLATTLHHLGHFNAAKKMYDEAFTELTAAQHQPIYQCLPFLDEREGNGKGGVVGEWGRNDCGERPRG